MPRNSVTGLHALRLDRVTLLRSKLLRILWTTILHVRIKEIIRKICSACDHDRATNSLEARREKEQRTWAARDQGPLAVPRRATLLEGGAPGLGCSYHMSCIFCE